MWLFTKGRVNPVRRVSERITQIRKEDRDETNKIKDTLLHQNLKLDKETQERVKRAVEATRKLMEGAEEKNEEFKETLKDDSDAINKALNDAVD
jgi:gas vesicle protein